MKIISVSMDIMSNEVVAVEDVTSFFVNDRNIKVSILRLDQLHPVISGNKYFKLKYNLQAVLEAGYNQIITFGGAYSNHLVATAAAAKLSGLQSIGIVRGFHAQDPLTPTLKACTDEGMLLHFVSRADYARKDDFDFLNELFEKYGAAFIIPEGGDNDLGRKGAGDIAHLIPGDATHICLPIGTGTSFSGIRNVLDNSKEMIGFPTVKGGSYLQQEIEKHLEETQNRNWQLACGFHFGGFAKTTDELLHFMQAFYQQTNIPLDIVYTGKMMFGIHELINEHIFPVNAAVLAIHTGGLQGNPDGLYQL